VISKGDPCLTLCLCIICSCFVSFTFLRLSVFEFSVLRKLFLPCSLCCSLLLLLVFSPWPVWQEPEPSQATGMALVRCILGKFLGVVCHCFPLHLDVPTLAARCLYVPNNASAPSSERWNYRARNGRLILLVTQLPCNHRVL
jgi:hypothetical protein